MSEYPVKEMTVYHPQTLMNRILGRHRPVIAANLGPISNLPKMPVTGTVAENTITVPLPETSTVAKNSMVPAVNTITVPLPKTNTVAENTITVPKPCTRLTPWQKGLLLVNHSTIDLSYDSPLYCELLTKLGKHGRLNTLSWAEIDRVLPKLDPVNPIVQIKVGGKTLWEVNLKGFLEAVKTVKVTGHNLITAQILEFFLGLSIKYPLLKPNTLIIDTCDKSKEPKVFADLQEKLRRIIDNITVKLQAGGRRTRRRKSRQSRKSRHR